MMLRFPKITLLFCAFVFAWAPLSLSAQAAGAPAESTEPEPYTDEEFPQWTKDLRRTEIITLGSLPFVALGVGTAYGSYLYFSGERDSFPNPFSHDDGYSNREILTIVGVSAGISVAVGMTDFIISYTKRKKAEREKALRRAQEEENIQPISPEDARELLHRSQQIRSQRNGDHEP